MKIKKIYTSKNNFGRITLVKDNPFVRVEQFLSKLDESCRVNYYDNKSDLKIYLADKLNFDEVSAVYVSSNNSIFIADVNEHLTHELMHMASTNRRGKSFVSFSTHHTWEDELIALEEGMAEFLSSKINDKPIETYGINSFVAKMLYTSTDAKILVPFFQANGQKFLSMFSEIDILNVLHNLSIFHYNNIFGTDVSTDFDSQGYRECFCDLLEALIDIELKKQRNSKQLEKYREVFLTSLEDEVVKFEVEDFYENFHNKARKLIDSRLKRR